MKDSINKDTIAEKSINRLTREGDLKKLSAQDAVRIAAFYEIRSLNRLQTAKLIYESSSKTNEQLSGSYSDHSESVSAAYYAMYYIVHAYLPEFSLIFLTT